MTRTSVTRLFVTSVNLTSVFAVSCHHYQEQVALVDIQSHFCFHKNDHTRVSRRILCCGIGGALARLQLDCEGRGGENERRLPEKSPLKRETTRS